jgi:hypothetical protein
LTTSLTDFGRERSAMTTVPSNRIYRQSGMIPRYTGYLPRKFFSSYRVSIDRLSFEERKYRCGQTFGDITRNLPVCSHSFSNYGDLVRSNSFLETSVTNFQ